MGSIEFWPDLLESKCKKWYLEIFEHKWVPIQTLHKVEIMKTDYNDHHQLQISITVKQFGAMLQCNLKKLTGLAISAGLVYSSSQLRPCQSRY